MQNFPIAALPDIQPASSTSDTAAVMMRSKTSTDFDSILEQEARDEATRKFRKTAPSESIEPTDILYLQQLLAQVGLPKEQVANLGELMVGGKKVSLDDLEKALTDKGYRELSSVTKMDAGTFLQKIGFSAAETDTLLSGLANGATQSVWQSIGQKLSGADLSSFSKEEFSALADGLRLNENAKKALETIFDEARGSAATAEASAQALALLQKSMDQQAATDSQFKKALADAMPEVLKKMEQRLAGQDQASGRVTKDEQYLSTVMHEKSFATTRDSMAHEESALQQEEADAKDREKLLKKWSASGEKKGRQESRVESLLDRMSSKISYSTQNFINAVAQAGDNGAGGNGQMSFAESLRQGALSSQQADSVLAQMEKGILESLADGTKQLTLQLNPEEMGTVNVILSVRSGEVSATIRPQSPEVTQAVEEQINKIQAALEQQGLKVVKLEVQTQLPDGHDLAQWQGSDQHNQEAMQRESARRARLARLLGTENASLARNVHSMGIRENLSQTGLNLIA